MIINQKNVYAQSSANPHFALSATTRRQHTEAHKGMTAHSSIHTFAWIGGEASEARVLAVTHILTLRAVEVQLLALEAPLVIEHVSLLGRFKSSK
jgi:hypothetical protein